MTGEGNEMTTIRSEQDELLRPLMLPGGGFAMLALDQRESLRRMFPLVHGQEVGDDVLKAFKRDAVAVLAPGASGVLLDRPFALADGRPAELPRSTGLIVAADVLEQPPGEPVVDTSLDPVVTADYVRSLDATAVKLLVIWRDDGGDAKREDLVRSFVSVAEEAGVASLVEGIVRPSSGEHWAAHAERHDAIIAAAAELSGYGGSIYKAEVPGYAPGDVSAVAEHAVRLTRAASGPWVVLSNGVAQADFADALAESVKGGASGFLAGRAIWSDTVRDPDPVASLRERSVERLERLALIVSQAHRS